jgi:ubiquinone/menaquinone biosynthesis C-methylase UbiE
MKEGGERNKNQETRAEQTYREYVSELKLSPEDLQKRILDVGSNTANFASEAAKRGFKNIVSVDKIHFNDRNGYEADKPYGDGRLAVANALNLPFKNNEFDLVVSIYAIPNGLESTEDMVKACLEMLRVTKTGGEVRLSGVHLRREPRPENDTGDLVALAIQDLMKQGVDVSIEDGPDGPDRHSVELAFLRLRKPMPVDTHLT